MGFRPSEDAAPFRVPWRSAVAIIVGVLAIALISAIGPADLGRRSVNVLDDFGFDPNVVATVNRLAADGECEQLTETLDDVRADADTDRAEGRDVDGLIAHLEELHQRADC